MERELSLALPKKFQDESGRNLSNTDAFPMKIRMADYPPLAKFPSAPFGIIELNADATLPLTLRSVETNMIARSTDGKIYPGNVNNLKVTDDQGIIAWLTKLNRYHENTITINEHHNELPTYLDSDGLAYYYPPNESNTQRGSDTLTAYLLAVTQEAGFVIPQQSRAKMLDGLTAFVEGKITRDFWSPKKDLDVRKLAALEAFSRYDRVRPSMLDSIQLSPNLWPTSAVLDWINILQRVSSIPDRAKRLAEADQIIRTRLNYQSTRMGFSTETDDYWWWLMSSGDVNATRLVLTMLDNPAWKEDMPKLINGVIQRQTHGHWATTTANVWGSLALQKFGRTFEADKVSGVTKASLEQGTVVANTQSFSWLAAVTTGGKLQLPWPATAAPANLKLSHVGNGAPWS